MNFLDKFILGVWNVGIIESDISKVMKSNKKLHIRWLKHNYKDRFFADPFLYSIDENNYYILVEEFPFYSNIGFISLLTIDKKTMQLVKKEKIIEGSCHLSYPFVYEGNIIPEAFRSSCCTSYQIEGNELINSNVIAPFGLIDQTFLKRDGYEWIFATDKDNPLYGLKIFYRGIGENEWKQHANNPVSEDICSARPGGHFFEINGQLYRPAQDSKKLYGHRIRIMRVDKLTPTEFKETEVKIISSENDPPYDLGFHTFNVEDGFIIVDGYKEYKSFFIKPLCLKAAPLMKMIGEKRWR